jgi:hypothetical protein
MGWGEQSEKALRLHEGLFPEGFQFSGSSGSCHAGPCWPQPLAELKCSRTLKAGPAAYPLNPEIPRVARAQQKGCEITLRDRFPSGDLCSGDLCSGDLWGVDREMLSRSGAFAAFSLSDQRLNEKALRLREGLFPGEGLGRGAVGPKLIVCRRTSGLKPICGPWWHG